MSIITKMMTIMTTSTMNNLRISFGVVLASALFFVGAVAHAQTEPLHLLVTPPLFQVSLSPDDVWQSSVKIVNTNREPLDAFVSVVNFEPDATGKLIPVLNQEQKIYDETLAGWITLETDVATVPEEKSSEIPFSITIPSDAPPGGHYAGILAGTQSINGSSVTHDDVSVGSLVSSLLFVRIEGDVVEDVVVTDFSVDKNVTETPDNIFHVVLENRGNAHTRIDGTVQIANLFGNVKDTLLLAQNDAPILLPGQSETFDVVWEGKRGFFDLAMRRATLSVTFGDDTQTITQQRTLFVIPKAQTAVTVLVLVIIILIILLIRDKYRAMITRAVRNEIATVLTKRKKRTK